VFPAILCRELSIQLMHRRPLRHGLVVLLFAAAAGAAAFAWSVDQRLSALAAAEHDASTHFDTLVQVIARFDTTQQLYDPNREPEIEWFNRVKRLLTTIESEARALLTSPASASAARTFDDVASRVAAAVARADENLRAGHDLMAADLVQDEARPGAEAMRAAVVEWRAAEGTATDAARAALVQQLWTVLGGVLAFWTIGLLLLAPRQTVAAPAPPIAASPGPAGETPIAAAEHVVAAEAAPAHTAPPLDLVPVAELCADIARADNRETLDLLVARAADVIGAAGIVVWLGVGEDELVPALAHGYSAHGRSLLGAIRLAEENMTTRAWHTGQLQFVEAVAGSRGAVAAPMFQGARRTGVLTVELGDEPAKTALAPALTSILAAQLAATVSPQPESAADGAPLEATGS
jgi:hypothetical protein